MNEYQYKWINRTQISDTQWEHTFMDNTNGRINTILVKEPFYSVRDYTNFMSNSIPAIKLSTAIGVEMNGSIHSLEQQLKVAKKVQKHQEKAYKKKKADEQAVIKRRNLAHKTLEGIASGEITKNTADRVEAAKAILNL